MTTVADRTRTTYGRMPKVEVLVGQVLDGVGLQRLALLLDDALSLRPSHLVVDLSACRTLDAAALQVLLDAHARALRAGGRLALRGIQGPHARIVALAGLSGVFTVLPPIDALEADRDVDADRVVP